MFDKIEIVHEDDTKVEWILNMPGAQYGGVFDHDDFDKIIIIDLACMSESCYAYIGEKYNYSYESYYNDSTPMLFVKKSRYDVDVWSKKRVALEKLKTGKDFKLADYDEPILLGYDDYVENPRVTYTTLEYLRKHNV